MRTVRGKSLVGLPVILIVASGLVAAGGFLAPVDATYSTSRVSGHIAFDKCEVMTKAQMSTWWTNSPFWDVGVYIGGENRACSNSALDNDWVTSIHNQGWNIIPIFNGLHPWCGSGVSFSRSSPHADGVTQANKADNKMQALGFRPDPGSGSPPVIYADLEFYSPSNTTCVGDTNSFVKGWVQRLHAIGYKAGAYASVCSGIDNLWNTQPDEPDQIYVADGIDSHPDVWGLTPSTCTDAGVPNSHWNGNGDRRLHQYNTNETRYYGLNAGQLVDFDCLNGRTSPDPDSGDVGTDDEGLGGTTEDPECSTPYP